MQPTTSGILGTSWPWNVFPAWARDDDLIDQAIKRIVFTSIKSRKKNLKFGSDALELVFENKGAMMEALTNREIGLALANNLPIVKVLNIDIVQSDSDNDPVEITVTWERNGVQGTTELEVETP